MTTTAILLFNFHGDQQRTQKLMRALGQVANSVQAYAPGVLFLDYGSSGREILELASQSQGVESAEILLTEISGAYGVTGVEPSEGAAWFRDKVVANYLAQHAG